MPVWACKVLSLIPHTKNKKGDTLSVKHFPTVFSSIGKGYKSINSPIIKSWATTPWAQEEKLQTGCVREWRGTQGLWTVLMGLSWQGQLRSSDM